jgi:curved DNA-binding protein CbpA
VENTPDYYEILQISPNAEPETIHRVYRMLAQRFHPDNGESGDGERFRQLVEAYQVLSNPEERVRYDIVHTQLRQERWRLVSENANAANDMEAEHLLRLAILELLYTSRRTNPASPGVSLLDLEALTGRAREHLEFTIWFLSQKKYVTQSDGAKLVITVDGVEHLETNFQGSSRHRLQAAH